MTQAFQKRLKIIVEYITPDYRSQAQSNIDLVLAMGAESYEDWLTLLPKPKVNPEIRQTICWTLERLGEETALPALLTALQAEESSVRCQAALALGTLGNPTSLPHLLTALNEDEDITVRNVAAQALGSLRGIKAFEPLIKILEDQQEPPQLRGHAAEALSTLRDDRAVIPLIKALRDDSAEVRFWSAFALGQLGVSEALPELKRLATTDTAIVPGWGAVKQEVEEAIKAIKNF